MKKARGKAGNSLRALLPRGKRERRKVEYLGGVAFAIFACIIVLTFCASGLHRIALRSPQVAAVVSAVLVQLANGDRAQNNLAALTVNPLLVAAAQAKANDMAEQGYFAHVSPQGVDPWHWFQQAGYAFTYAGENLAVDFSDSGDVNTAWMNSPAHRENILDPHYTEIGIATAQGMYQGRPTVFVVQEFGAPAAGTQQAPVAKAVVPSTPTKIAEATTKPSGTQVLGEQAARPSTPATVATTEPALAASLAQSAAKDTPLWAPLVGFPRDALRYAYYCLGALVLLALVLDTGLELHWHHRKRAMRAGALLCVMCGLFIVADLWFFPPPVLAGSVPQSPHDAQAASAAVAL